MADWTDSIAPPFDQYLTRLPRLERNTLRRLSVLHWFDRPLYKSTQNKKLPLEFEQFISLQVISPLNRVRPNQFVVLPALREQLAAILREEHAEEYITVHRLAANHFRQPLNRVNPTTVGETIEELSYLAVIDPTLTALRLARFGRVALLTGMAEAASRAARAVEVAPSVTPKYDHLLPLARLVSTLAAVLTGMAYRSVIHPERSWVELRALVRIFKPQDDSEEMLVELAREVIARAAQAMPRQEAASARRIPVKREVALLTAREQEILSLVAEGYSNREVASRLFLSPNTVKTHLSSVLRKLQLSTRHQLTQWASEHHST